MVRCANCKHWSFLYYEHDDYRGLCLAADESKLSFERVSNVQSPVSIQATPPMIIRLKTAGEFGCILGESKDD